VFLVGFDPETDFTIRPWLDSHPEMEVSGDRVLTGSAMVMAPGDTVRFYGREFTVAGSLTETGSGLDATVFIPLEAAYRMAAESSFKAERTLTLAPGMISAVMIKLRPGNEGGLSPARASLELNKGVYEISVIEPGRMLKRAHRHLDAAVLSLRAAGLGMWPLTALLLGLVFAMTVNERRFEIGALRALGASRGLVHLLITAEALGLAGVGAALGAAAGAWAVLGFSGLIAPALEVPFLRPAPGEVLALAAWAVALSLVTAALAGFGPAWSASRMEPYQAMRGE
jgi:putative ABC transport system permease protein